MGVDTHGFLRKEITATDIYNVIISKFDKEAIFDIKKDSYDNKEIGRISFKDGQDNRSIFYCVTEDIIKETEFAEGMEHVSLSLGYWNNSVQIMTEIIKCFGGYVDENDCDEVEAFYIPKDDNFKYDEYIIARTKIEEILDNELDKGIKITIANQILKHKEDLLNLMG